jgi:hypothetical protein
MHHSSKRHIQKSYVMSGHVIASRHQVCAGHANDMCTLANVFIYFVILTTAQEV